MGCREPLALKPSAEISCALHLLLPSAFLFPSPDAEVEPLRLSRLPQHNLQWQMPAAPIRERRALRSASPEAVQPIRRARRSLTRGTSATTPREPEWLRAIPIRQRELIPSRSPSPIPAALPERQRSRPQSLLQPPHFSPSQSLRLLCPFPLA